MNNEYLLRQVYQLIWRGRCEEMMWDTIRSISVHNSKAFLYKAASNYGAVV